jgi:hypothetical protein
MRRRNLHGGTTRPPLARPGNGFGRVLRPGPNDQRTPADCRAPAPSLDHVVERLLEVRR